MSIIGYKYEEPVWQRGKTPAGVDEAGRGCLAGPVVAACVVLSPLNPVDGIDDSKSLSPSRRKNLCETIKKNCLAYSIGIVENDEIDRINILNATIKAMEIGITSLSIRPDITYIDGNKTTDLDIKQMAIVQGDKKCNSIAAASIIAKVTRDSIMKKLHDTYPQYNFGKHKGYPTKKHYEAIEKYGPCSIHRLSYKGVTKL